MYKGVDHMEIDLLITELDETTIQIDKMRYLTTQISTKAWAMSIHKSQGQTFGQVNIDPRCWDSGQFYVAVSRAEAVAGIHFMAPIMKQYIRTLSDEVIKILRESLYSII